MKTLKEFEKIQKLELTEYLPEPCEIDWDLYSHVSCGYVASSYLGASLSQAGEAHDTNEDDVYTYMTVSEVNGKYFYLGILPGFKTEEN